MTSQFVGIPFNAGAAGYGGADCWGLIRLVYHVMWGVTFPDVHYSQDGYAAAIAAHFSDFGFRRTSVKPGLFDISMARELDVVGFRFGPEVCHLGVIMDGSILHTYDDQSSVLEKPHRRMLRRITEVYRYGQE